MKEQPFADLQLKTLTGNFKLSNVSLYVDTSNSSKYSSRWLQFETVKGNVDLNSFESGSIQGHDVSGNVNLSTTSEFWGNFELKLSNTQKKIQILDPLSKMGDRIRYEVKMEHYVRGTVLQASNGKFTSAQMIQYIAHDGDLNLEFV